MDPFAESWRDDLAPIDSIYYLPQSHNQPDQQLNQLQYGEMTTSNTCNYTDVSTSAESSDVEEAETEVDESKPDILRRSVVSADILSALFVL